ncbi:HIT family protein [Candidatus Woesearchaeota archaeon]|nr:HIT family protein [Candidatus Woesearchaeota archaeon]
MKQKRGCSKCKRLKDKDYFYNSKRVVAYFSRPDFKGHTVVMVKRHVESFARLTDEEAKEFALTWRKIGKAIEKVLKPDIINYQINCNWVRHVHGHIYPRFKKFDKAWGEPIKIPGKNARFKKHEMTEKEKQKIVQLVNKR